MGTQIIMIVMIKNDLIVLRDYDFDRYFIQKLIAGGSGNL
jgi:hypothetical protein